MSGLPQTPLVLELAAEVVEIQARRRDDRPWAQTAYAKDRRQQAERSDRYYADEERLLGIQRFLSQIASSNRVTVDEYLAMLEDQDRRCAICRRELGPDRLPCVDHNHATGEVRGLLCGPCNTSLGVFMDSPAVLENALDYLLDRGHYGPTEVPE